MRVGGFGGADGLAAWLRANAVTHVVDATHPFAAQISRNAVVACRMADVPLIALTRPPWEQRADDRWTTVADIQSAARALPRAATRVMLAIGRTNLDLFADAPQHVYLLRLVDAPKVQPPFPNARIVVDRGPFSEPADRALLQHHDIQLIVAKNAGGDAAYSKVAAARALALPVLMVQRPVLPARRETHDVTSVFDWIAHLGADLGV